MSIFGSISDGIEATAENITRKLEAPIEIVEYRTHELSEAVSDTFRYLHPVELSVDTTMDRVSETPVAQTTTVDFMPTPPQSETLAPLKFTDETFTAALPTDVAPTNEELDTESIRATLKGMKYAPVNEEHLHVLAPGSQE